MKEVTTQQEGEGSMKEVVIDGVVYVPKSEALPKVKGDYCIVRTYSAGVFARILTSHEGKNAVVKKARRLWHWEGAATLSQLAMEGVKNVTGCKVPCEVAEVRLTEVIEVSPCTDAAVASIASVPIWKL